MRTLIISDLHLGTVTGADILRRAELRAPLLEALADVDRLVLLGDVLELRHGPPRDVMTAARPFFEDVGRALAGRELVVVSGNHDHALIEPWLARRSEEDHPSPLDVEQQMDATGVSPMLARIAEWAVPARVVCAYPGLWIRPDVYAIHGHYLDAHLTVPTFERLSVGAMSRLLRRPPEDFAGAEDYEAVSAPVFAWRDAVARDGLTGSALNGVDMVAAWRVLGSDSRRGPVRGPEARSRRTRGLVPRLRRRALVAAFPLAVAALNRAGFGPLRAEVSTAELRRAGLAAMGEVASRLGLQDTYVVFGHTHRSGPLEGDREEDWVGVAGARLVNAGCWIYAPVFVGRKPGESPYWPGTCVLVEDSGPPLIKRLLLDRTHAELKRTPG